MPSGVYIRTEETRLKIIKSLTGRPCSEETRKKISIANTGKICSQENKQKSRDRMLGIKPSKETRKKMSKAHIGRKGYWKGVCEENHPHWKGEKAGYIAIHNWVRKHNGKAKICELCGKKKTTPKSIQWANIDHKYRRNLDDYISLCVPCHRRWDIKYNNYNNQVIVHLEKQL